MAFLGWDNYGRYDLCDTETTFDYDGKKYRTDLIYFENDKDQKYLQKLKNRKEYQKKLKAHVEEKHNIIVEAKKLGVLRTNSNKNDDLKKDSTQGKTPEGQLTTYMEMLRSQYGILTDGGIWKLFHNAFRDEDKFVTFDFGKLALWLINIIKIKGFALGNSQFRKEEEELEFLLALFYNLFSKEAITGEKICHLVEYTQRYSEKLEEKIKDRFVFAMTHACNGLIDSIRKQNENPGPYLNIVQKTAESHLFSIIFFRSLESKGILPYFGDDNSYNKISISRTIDAIYENNFDPSRNINEQFKIFEKYYDKKIDSETTVIFDSLVNLYKSVHQGISNGIHIEGFKESIFTKEEWKFLNKYRINDEYMMNVIFYLNFTLKDKDRELGEYQLIPYDFLTPREIGSIFESFLEFKLEKTKISLYWDYKNKQWLKNNNKIRGIRKNEIINKNNYFFSPDGQDRKKTGAYYTPHCVVEFIVRNTISLLCEKRHQKIF